MITQTLLPNRVHGVGKGNSPSPGITVPLNAEFVQVVLHRRGWKTRRGNSPRSKEVLRVGLWIQLDEGSWEKLMACGTHGGDFEQVPGNPAAGIKPTSSMSRQLPGGTNRRVRVDYDVRVPNLNTKIDVEFRTAAEESVRVIG